MGTILARAFVADGHEVVVLSRGLSPAPWRSVAWDARTLGAWTAEIDGADVVINLAGRNVNCRYDARNKAEIMASRIDSTRAVGQAIAAAARPPAVWLQASTATIYAHRFDAANDEKTGVLGGNEPDAPGSWSFSIEVARAWEKALDDADTPRTRRVALRAAVVMSPDPGGPFDLLSRLVRLGLGGRVGNGRQYVSWVHYRDLVEAIRWIIARHEISGPVIIASPDPLPNAEFMRVLRAAWGMPIGLPATAWMVEIGAALLRTESELALKSRRVVPGRLLESGFEFALPTWPEAARDLRAAMRTSA